MANTQAPEDHDSNVSTVTANPPATGYYLPDVGWEAYTRGKRSSPGLTQTCGAAFGDSFTHGDEVEASQSWPFILSAYLGCNIDNFGVGGFGLDQSYLKYLKYRPQPGQVVIIGLYQEMLRRNFAASWRFYASHPNTLPKPFFRLGESGLILEAAPERLDQESIRAHHKFDRYADPYRVEFPYFVSLVRVLYYRLFRADFARNRIEPRERAWTDPDPVRLCLAILQAFLKSEKENGNIPVVLMIPNAEEVAENARPYINFVSLARSEWPSLCIVDPFDLLREQYGKGLNLSAPRGHFTGSGNEAIALALFQAIQKCHLAIAESGRADDDVGRPGRALR
jgi:hypothetical protein